MDVNGGQLTVRQLEAAGIDTLFWVLAGPMIEVLSGAVERGIRVINCRHEESAGFMGWGWAKQKPGVWVVGPGMTHAITPMYVATESAMPLVVLGGSVHGATRNLGGFQEADQTAYASPGCKWTCRIDSVARTPEYLHLALGKSASGRPGAVYLDYAGEMVSGRVPEEQVRLRAAPRSISPPHPDPNAIDRLAEMLEGHPERVDLADEIRPALERALAADRPALVHVRIDSKATRLSGGVYLRWTAREADLQESLGRT